ncbi:NADP-dependent 3-hydroxy acid dehydrogenase YdfG [Roseiarcus fermentans]|uniref:NADP-dependent 3-hydroxy acid dehydrogenase YdfG n=1 Tax=Roseiarcus fermentans TaxID=1473586 RepID=A0A366FWJ5_9HYPH|nr:SDR family NAD(P)-dependent oxidoreductase [Roseiarcus fermentans]RBP18115.1 NADP-dependent 3-hydroxy acid dehydrogenase YdfG [Roseiarcus fermentans]
MANHHMDLTGKVAIVTGAASGIGEAVSKLYCEHGCKILGVDVDRARLAKVAEEIEAAGGVFETFLADVTEEASVRAFFKDAFARWGRIDVLVNSAGRDSLAPPVTQVTLEEWNKTIGPNLTAVFLCCREAFLYMEKQASGGRIINMGSSSTRIASGPGHSPYRASKHGMLGFSKNILLEGKDKKIGVTVLNPSHVKTPMTEIIDKGLYDGDLPAYLDGWLDEKELKEGIHASCIDVDNVAWLALFVATRSPDVTIPTIALYPTHKAHRYGMEV